MKNLLKKMLCAALCLAFAVSVFPAALATSGTKSVEIAYRGISIVVGGSVITPCDATGKAVEPFILDGTTYLPVRAVANALGLDVKWDSATSTVTITDGAAASFGSGTPAASTGKQTIEAAYRDIKIVVNGKTIVPTDANGNAVEPFIYDGTTYLPVRAVANALGVEVDWDAATSTVSLGTVEVYLPKQELTEYFTSGAVSSSIAVSYTYDAKGVLTAQAVTSLDETEALSYAYLFTYDAKGNLLKKYDPEDGETHAFTYDANGNCIKYSYTYDCSSEEMAYTYDASGNMLTYDYNAVYCDGSTGSESFRFTYDKNGNCLSQSYSSSSDGGYVIKYTCDANGNCILEEYTSDDGYTYTEKYTYDANGNMLTDTYTDSYDNTYVTKYTYNSDGNVLTADYSEEDGYSSTTKYTYNSSGNLIKELYSSSYGDAYSETYTYDANGNMLTDVYADSDVYTSAFTYTYDANGNLVSSVSTIDGALASRYTCEYVKLDI